MIATGEASGLAEGALIAVEGLDRSGKSTLATWLAEQLRQLYRVDVGVFRERQSPAGALLDNSSLPTLTPLVKTLLFAADRAWSYEKRCLPILRSGGIVVADRWVDSSIVNRIVQLKHAQSLIDLSYVKIVQNPFVRPRVSLLLDIEPETVFRRAIKAGLAEPYSLKEYRSMRIEYLQLAKERKNEYIVINAERSSNAVQGDALRAITLKLGEKICNESR